MSAAPSSPALQAPPSHGSAPPCDGRSVVLPGQTPDGGHVLAVLLKRSYAIRAGEACRRAPDDQPLNAGDVFWDTPMNSSVRMESDFVPYKPQTDVVLIGRAHAPGGRAAAECPTALQVGACSKRIVVTGERRAGFTSASTPPVFSDPQPFVSMGLRYERAYGGTDVHSDTSTIYPYPRNPRGRGFAVANARAAVEGLALPNLEDPADRLTPERLCVGDYARWSGQPLPAGYGWFPRIWQPRALLAGILPADRATERELRAAYAKLVPAEHREAYVRHGLPDMNFDFFNGASAGLTLPFGALRPGETVRTLNLAPEGRLDFMLPGDAPRLGLDIGSGVEAPQTVLHTVQIRLEERELDLVWRAAVPYPGRDWLPQLRRLAVTVG